MRNVFKTIEALFPELAKDDLSSLFGEKNAAKLTKQK
jgi:hypothetical protein